MFFNLFIIPDKQTHGPIRLIIACLVFVFTLILSGMLALNHFVDKFHSDLNTNLVFEIPLHNIDSTKQQQILDTLQQTINAIPYVKESFVVMPRPSGQIIPSSVFIEVHLSPKSPFVFEELLQNLQKIYPGIHRQSQYFIHSQLAYVSQSLKIFSYALIILVSFIIVVTISLITRSNLKMYQQVIDILRLIGAPNSYIAQQFQGIAFRVGLLSSFLGVVLGISAFVFMTYVGTRFGWPEDFILLDQNFLMVLIGLPFCVGVLSLLVSRVEVMRTLIKLES